MDPVRALIDNIREVRGAYQVAALAVVAAGVVVFVSPVVAGTILIVALGAFVFGSLPQRQTTLDAAPPETNPARGTLFAVADEHLPQQRPQSISDLDWVIFRHLKSDPNFGLGKEGSLPARYFIDLREAALIPAQCEVLLQPLCAHIRDQISVENHHAVIIPKAGNVHLGMAVARELGLAPVLVRDWPFYGRWVETLVSSGRGIVVDDVSTLGEILIGAAIHARDAGFIINRAFLLIRRSEGNTDELLEEHRLSLSAVFEMSDADVEELINRVRQA
jgi:orotate phosphoribosyltransferase